MHQIKILLPILGLLLLTTCIKPYTPVIEGDAANKVVVAGRITNNEGWQEVSISISSPIGDPELIPMPGCMVNVLDNLGNNFQFPENEPGIYRAWLGSENLVPGTLYKITVDTPEGERIESAYDTLMPGALLDSVYYIIEELPTSDPTVFLNGMQFYVDLNGTENESKNYKWEVKETWEFHAARPVEYYYDGQFHQVIPPDSSKLVCWSNVPVREVFTLSTKTLSQNSYQKYPLQFVDGLTTRLSVLYSILVTQLALSENAFNYWEEMRINSIGLGGLYEKQPFAIKGNLVNLTNPEKDVLGYFYAVTESSRRYFYKDVEGLELDFIDYCNEMPLGRKGWIEYTKKDYPVYYYYNQYYSLRIINVECVDCRKGGGTTTKPDFWPY